MVRGPGKFGKADPFFRHHFWDDRPKRLAGVQTMVRGNKLFKRLYCDWNTW